MHLDLDQLISDRPFCVRRFVRWGDCDPATIAYTPVFVDYCVNAIGLFVQARAGVRQVSFFENGTAMPYKALSVEFHSPIATGDAVDITVTPTRIGHSSISYAIAGVCAERAVFDARVTHVCVDTRYGQPCAMPEALRAGLAQDAAELDAAAG